MNKTNAIEVNKKIREMIKEKLNITADADEITDEFSFGVANGFDSTSLLEFILEIEDTFDIVIPDDDLIPDNFSSISKITDYIVSLMEE